MPRQTFNSMHSLSLGPPYHCLHFNFMNVNIQGTRKVLTQLLVTWLT